MVVSGRNKKTVQIEKYKKFQLGLCNDPSYENDHIFPQNMALGKNHSLYSHPTWSWIIYINGLSRFMYRKSQIWGIYDQITILWSIFPQNVGHYAMTCPKRTRKVYFLYSKMGNLSPNGISSHLCEQYVHSNKMAPYWSSNFINDHFFPHTIPRMEYRLFILI